MGGNLSQRGLSLAIGVDKSDGLFNSRVVFIHTSIIVDPVMIIDPNLAQWGGKKPEAIALSACLI